MSAVSGRGGRPARLLLLVIIPMLAALVGTALYLRGGRYVETDNAYVKADIVLLGAERAGRVVAVKVAENQSVQAGQVLLLLDDAQARLDIERAEAALARERAGIEALRASYREKEAEIELARTRLSFARRDRQRQSELVQKRFAPATRFDEARQAVIEIERQITALNESLERIGRQLNGGPATPIDEHPAVRAAQAELEQAQLALRHTRLMAPTDGVVSRLPPPGRYLNVGQPALTLIASRGLWIEANFTETDLTHMRVGQQAEVKVDAFPNAHWRAEVDSLSPATGAEFSILPAQNATGNWVKIPQRLPVRLRLVDDGDQPPLRAGLSAVVSIDTGHERTLLGWRP
ncbi:MAG: HlyD family secretion protein [Burkholderiaceae bacterium]